MSSALVRDTEDLGLVRLCTRCLDEWPLDEVFWYFDRAGRVLGPCKACWSERKRTTDGRRTFDPVAR